jgi:simple sugar transport system permease protein
MMRLVALLRDIPGKPVFPTLTTVLLLIILFCASAAFYPGLASPQVVANLLIDNAFLLVLAVGMGFVIISGGIDLSVGAVLALTTMSCAWLLQTWHWPGPAVVAVVLLCGALYGAAMGALIHFFKLQAFIVTLAGMFLARGLCYLIGVESVTIDDSWFVALSRLQLPLFDAFLSISAIIALCVLAVAVFVAHWTAFGRTVYAIGGNEQSAQMMGLQVARTRIVVYAISGFCAALSGVLFSFYMLSGYALHGQGVELDAIAAVVIGGVLLTGGHGYLAGTLSGVLMLGLIQTIIAFDGSLSSWWTKIIIGALLFVFCLMQRLITIYTARRSTGSNAGS